MKFLSINHRSGAGMAALLALVFFIFAASPSFAGSEIASGTFEGRSKHVTTGTVTIKREAGKIYAVLGSDFSLDGAPAPSLGFANGETFDVATEFANLASKTGAQTYEIPAHIDPGKYDHFVIWCSKFAVPLGTAALK
jgi:hypothetical protein